MDPHKPGVRNRSTWLRAYLGIQQVVVGHEDDVSLLLQVPGQVVWAQPGAQGKNVSLTGLGISHPGPQAEAGLDATFSDGHRVGERGTCVQL